MRRDPLLTVPFTLASLANFVQGLAFMLFLHFPRFLHDLDASEVEIGVIVAVAAVASVAIRPAIGRAMDRRGRRQVILFGNALNVVVIGLYLTVSTLGPWVYVVRIAHGLSEAMLFTSLFTLAADQVPASRRTEGLALFGVSGMIPIAVAGVLGDAILARSDFDTLFLTATVLAAIALLLALPLRDVPLSAAEASVPQQGFFGSLRQADLRPLWFITLVFATAIAAYWAFLATYTEETGIGTVGGFFAAYAATAIGLRVTLGWLPDRIGQKPVLYPALAVLSLGFVTLAMAESGTTVALAGVLCGAGHGFVFPILYSLVVTRVAAVARGSALAIYTALFDLGVLIGGPLFGLAIQWTGYRGMYLTAAAVVALGTGVFAARDRAAVGSPVIVTGSA